MAKVDGGSCVTVIATDLLSGEIPSTPAIIQLYSSPNGKSCPDWISMVYIFLDERFFFEVAPVLMSQLKRNWVGLSQPMGFLKQTGKLFNFFITPVDTSITTRSD